MSDIKPAAPVAVFYHLFTVEVAFHVVDKPETGTARALNVLLTSPDGCVGEEMIGQANVAAQTRLHKEAGDVQLQVVDCVIMSVSPLGYQSPEQFRRRTAKLEPLSELLGAAPNQ